VPGCCPALCCALHRGAIAAFLNRPRRARPRPYAAHLCSLYLAPVAPLVPANRTAPGTVRFKLSFTARVAALASACPSQPRPRPKRIRSAVTFVNHEILPTPWVHAVAPCHPSPDAAPATPALLPLSSPYRNYNVGISRGQGNIAKKRRCAVAVVPRAHARRHSPQEENDAETHVCHTRTMCCPAARPGSLDQQEIPALLSHRVPPVDTLFVAVREGVVVDAPYFLEQLFHPTK
jgi:hypothetical protein